MSTPFLEQRQASIKNPINDVGVTTIWGLDDINLVLEGTQ